MTSRNWSTATLLDRLLKVLEEEEWGSAKEILDDPSVLDGTSASSVISTLKNRVISDAMKGRV